MIEARRIFSLICVVFLFQIYTPCSLPAEPENEDNFTGVIVGNAVNIRSGPSENYEILSKMDNGDLVLVEGQMAEWYKVKLPRNSAAYIYKDYINPGEGDDLIGYINADRVNVRAGKGTNFSVLGPLNRNDYVEVIAREGEWVKIYSVKNCSAWVSQKYVKNLGKPSIYAEKEKIFQQAVNLFSEAQKIEQEKPSGQNKQVQYISALEKYKLVAEKYPDTLPAQIAEQRIVMLKQKIKQKEPAGEILSQPPLSQDLPLEGIILELGRFFNRPGTHKLIQNRKLTHYLKSEKINLDEYIYYRVQLKGKPLPNPDSEIPIIEVKEIKKLN